ncbi:MAG: sensor histidine kinase [Nitrospinota bacterium]|nr:sensor histidine kinase [Nitrospinota bacterium]
MKFFILVSLLLSASSQAGYASPPIIITNSENSHLVGLHMDYLEDPERQLTFDQVANGPASVRFAPLGKQIPNFSFSRSAFWLRFSIRNDTEEAQPLILHQFTPWIDSMDLYLTWADGRTELRRAGEKYPFAQREVEHNHFLFRLDLRPGDTVNLMMRVESLDPLQLPLTVWKENAFWPYSGKVHMYFGLVFGCLLVVFFYNMLLYFSLRDITYLHYILYILSLLLMIFTYSGYAYQYVWPLSPRLQNWMVFPSGYLSMFMAIFIAKSFLNTARNMPTIHKGITAFQALCVLLPVYGYIMDDYLFTSLTCSLAALMFPFAMGGAGVLAYIRKVPAAKFFILAWVSSLTGQLISMGTVIDLTPSTEIMRRMMEIGFMADAVFLSFALADRISVLRREKEVAEAKVIDALETAKVELEAKVADRTAKLSQEKNKAEEATLLKDKFVALVSHDLRSPLGSMINMLELVKPEKTDLTGTENNRRLMSMATRAAHGLMDMIDNLLDISRLQTGSVRVSKKQVNVRLLIESIAQTERFRADEKEVQIVNQVPPDYFLHADYHLYGEVIQNLLSNAVKFCRPGDSVTIYRPEDQPGALAIRDTGVGIPPDTISHLFDHSQKTTSQGTAGERGSGLGLPYCHDIMEAHGGYIRVESEPGSGSVFTITAPEQETEAQVGAPR